MPMAGTRDERGPKRSEGFIHTKLVGKISCRAYTIGPAAVRIGDVTIIVADRPAAVSIAQAAVFFDDIAPKLGYNHQQRIGLKAPNNRNALTALATFTGTQPLNNPDLITAFLAPDGCGQASITIGNVRITVCDRDAAGRVAKALTEAYEEARLVHSSMLTVAQVSKQLEHITAQIPAAGNDGPKLCTRWCRAHGARHQSRAG